jgi:hypothetical protein
MALRIFVIGSALCMINESEGLLSSGNKIMSFVEQFMLVLLLYSLGLALPVLVRYAHVNAMKSLFVYTKKG